MCCDFFAEKVLYMGVFVVLLAAAAVLNVTANRCRWYRLAMPYEGMYCIGEGTVTHKLLPHHCQSMCLQSATCKAYNYNVTEGTCTQFSSPCPQAFSDPVMEFVVFRTTPVNRCYEWVPYSRGEPLDERMIATDNPRFIVARLQVNNNDVVSHFTVGVDHCFGGLGDTEYSTVLGYQCERLRVDEGCTIFWVPYTAGGHLPSQAVIGGSMANGDVPYVVKYDAIYNGVVDSTSGYYIEGATHVIGSHGGEPQMSVTMMVMVVL